MDFVCLGFFFPSLVSALSFSLERSMNGTMVSVDISCILFVEA